MSKEQKKKNPTQYIGVFTQATGESFIGDLRLKGANTLLKLHSDIPLSAMTSTSSLEGTAYTGECITLIDCYSPGSGHTFVRGQPVKYHTDVFPHFVAIGNRHLIPENSNISTIEFSTDDLGVIFHDFDAFGRVIDSKTIIDSVLDERRKIRPVESGERPLVAYFTGKCCIIEVSTEIGKISVNHRPSFNMGGPSGVRLDNRITVSIEPEFPITFDEAVDRLHRVANFLSVAAGRSQGISHVRVHTDAPSKDSLVPLSIIPTLPWKSRSKISHLKPHPGDTPLDAVRRPDEFDIVLSNWFKRDKDWRVARVRHLGCMQKGNKYDTDRLVAAANMFDILPQHATPLPTELSEELINTRDTCRELFRKLPVGIDRNSALDALGRLGKPSLPKKIAYRASIVTTELGSTFPELQLVASIAVKCRNFFVHGSAGDVDYSKVEAFIPFLTDTLEFIFASSDLIESGWNPQQWSSEHHGWGHSFSRYQAEYAPTLGELKLAIAN
ncbi:HEPN domain-containing protein [Pseudomonas nunensis]|uniref:ApeA N-terminal domain 1-containing protein n=1 Tax=Pseudomonas nunensis TaxID=2961896 RepID=UPI000ABB9F63|nr:HEPN domain-containing protein [Pseudomonas nunensis]